MMLNEISDIVFPFEFPKITNAERLCLLSFDDKKEYLIENLKLVTKLFLIKIKKK